MNAPKIPSKDPAVLEEIDARFGVRLEIDFR